MVRKTTPSNSSKTISLEFHSLMRVNNVINLIYLLYVCNDFFSFFLSLNATNIICASKLMLYLLTDDVLLENYELHFAES